MDGVIGDGWYIQIGHRNPVGVWHHMDRGVVEEFPEIPLHIMGGADDMIDTRVNEWAGSACWLYRIIEGHIQECAIPLHIIIVMDGGENTAFCRQLAQEMIDLSGAHIRWLEHLLDQYQITPIYGLTVLVQFFLAHEEDHLGIHDIGDVAEILECATTAHIGQYVKPPPSYRAILIHVFLKA